MSYRSPVERRFVRARRLRLLGMLVGLGVLGLWLDRPVHWLVTGDEQQIERNDWYQMFRAVGFLPTWLAVGGALALAELRTRSARPAGLLVMGSATLSGLLAELLKVVLGRHRPDANGMLDWNPLLGAIWDPDKYGSSLGLPSSHTAVAFGGALAVALLYPGTRWLMIVLAGGCALTRLMAGAHALTDVYVAALLSWAVAAMLTHRWRTHRRLVQIG